MELEFLKGGQIWPPLGTQRVSGQKSLAWLGLNLSKPFFCRIFQWLFKEAMHKLEEEEKKEEKENIED